MPDSSRITKPQKPNPQYPLFAHATKRWAKKIRGKTHYFGPWDDPDGALDKYLREKDYLHAGKVPPVELGGLTVHQLCNAFCDAKELQADAGDIRRRTYDEYFTACEHAIRVFGKGRMVSDLRAADFDQLRSNLSKGRNPNTVGNLVQRIRVAFNYAFQAELIDRPVRFGPMFKRPAKRIRRALRQAKGPKLFEARHLRRIIKSANQPLRAMLLLAINCGFGPEDCGRLPLSAVDLKAGWIEFPRPKTAVPRRVPLWPETVAEIREWLDRRPKPKKVDAEGLMFVTKYGGPWATDTPDSPVSKEYRKLSDRLGLYRPGLTFYALRHTFETIAGGGQDQVAVNAIMGHVDNTMAGEYRESIDDSRLVECVNVVRRWLFRRESGQLSRGLNASIRIMPTADTAEASTGN